MTFLWLYEYHISHGIVAAGVTFAAILGCWSPATQKFSLFTTETSPIISYLANATGFNETQFRHPDLPDAWAWGFSGTNLYDLRTCCFETLTGNFVCIGTCQLYNDPSKDPTCYHAFPPLFTIEDLVGKALSSSKEPGTAETISTWNSALAAKPSDPTYLALAQFDSRRSRSVSLFRGAAAAVIFSLFISFNNCFSSVSLFFLSLDEKSERKYRHVFFGIAIFDFLLYAGALVMFSFAMVDGPAALSAGGSAGKSSGSLGDVGFIVMLVALALRIMSIPIVGIIVVCIRGFELLLVLLVGYVIWKCMFKVVEDHQPVGC